MMKLSKLFALSALVLAPLALQSSDEYKLKDFKGEYIAEFVLGGSPNVPVAPLVQVAPTANLIAIAKVDDHGHGQVVYISESTFTGPVPLNPPIQPLVPNVTTIRSAAGAPIYNFEIQITNKHLGVGIVTFSDFPAPGITTTSDFIAKYDSKGKKIEKLFLNTIDAIEYLGVGPFVAERR